LAPCLVAARLGGSYQPAGQRRPPVARPRPPDRPAV